jgi:hypothetical protein
MSQNNDDGLSQTDELICPPMTLAQQVKGTIYLTRLTLQVARLVIAIIKLVKPSRSVTSPPMREIDAGLGGDSEEMENNVAE